MKNHLNEISDIDYSNDPTIFYSTSSTLEGIRALCDLDKDPVFGELSALIF